MKSKHIIRYIIILILTLTAMTGCKQVKPLNQQVAQSNANWYLYQGDANGRGNLMQLHFYSDQTVSVKTISWFNRKSGANLLNSSFGNPTYRLNKDGKEIIINTTPPRMVIALKNSYQETIHGYTLKGYTVTYQGNKWKLGKITHTNAKVAQAYQKKRRHHQAIKVAASDKLGSTLMKHVVDPNQVKAAKTAQLDGKSIAGEYNYRAMQANSRVYGHLSIAENGVFTNTVYIHAPQSKDNPDIDNPVIMQQQTLSGYLTSLYGKLYFKPLNLLKISYFTGGQNIDNPSIKAINLATDTKKYGNNIGQKRWRLEWGKKDLLLYNKDFQPWASADEGDEVAIHLHSTEQSTPKLPEQYNQIYQHYLNLQKQPVASNADLRQYVAAVASKHHSAIAGIGVNINGKFSITQPASNYLGVDRSGQKQAPMQYLALMEPEVLQEKKNAHTVTTPEGEFLIFGISANKLYLLEQPDSDSNTVTWAPFRNFPVQLPQANITWN